MVAQLSEAYVDFVAGWFSGAASIALCQPLDTILTRLQAGNQLVSDVVSTPNGARTSTAATTTTTTTASTAFQRGCKNPGTAISNSALWLTSARDLANKAGWRALWWGSSPMMGAVPIQNALLMGGYGIGQKYSELYAPDARLTSIFVGGCTGGVIQCFITSPIELIKVTQQCAGKTAFSAGKEWLFPDQRHHNHRAAWAACFRGLSATLLRDGIPHGVWFVSYEACKNALLSYLSSSSTSTSTSTLLPIESTSWQLNGPEMPAASATSTRTSVAGTIAVPLISGAVAATIAWTVGYPADLIKTRIQATGNIKSVSQPLGVVETARILIDEAGGNVVAGLYRGFGLKLLRAIPSSMVGFGVYEFVKSRLV